LSSVIGNKFLLSNNLKTLRDLCSISIKLLGKSANISPSSLEKYEFSNITPTINNLIKLSDFYSISIDFLLLWDKTQYPKNLKLLNLAKNLDDMKFESRTRVEGSALSFLGNNTTDSIKLDGIENDLSDNIHENISILRENKKVSQKQLAELLDVNQSQIAHYQNKSVPSLDKIIKLSEFFRLSVHAIVTGQKLYFQFIDGHFGKTMLLADQLLTLEEHKMLIHLMKAIINNKT